MIRIEKTEVLGWEASIRGMRNPMNSWDKSDSELCSGADGFEDCHVNAAGVCPRHNDFRHDIFCVGQKDLDLMKRLRASGTDHRKFMRMITVYVDITAPLYWWKEFDTYKVGTVANSCSTMHKIHSKEFTLNDFSHEHLTPAASGTLSSVVERLNFARKEFLKGREESDFGMPSAKDYWWDMIQLLPSSYNQKRTVMLNYEVLANIYKSRKNHKLDEWHDLCRWIEGLPYSELITCEKESET